MQGVTLSPNMATKYCVTVYVLKEYSRGFNADPSVFPQVLEEYWLFECMLEKAFTQGQNCWTLDRSVTVEFNGELHTFLRNWPLSRSASETTVERFYLFIYENFQSRISSRPDNVYMYV